MNEEKKFLDLEGLKILWNQINLNDYPNNETLIAILNAIDETKADKSELNTNNILHGENILSTIVNDYLLNIDYNFLVFDTTEIVIKNSTSSILGEAILGSLVLA